MFKKGITLIELVIVVIILTLLSVVSLWIGTSSNIFPKSEAAMLFSEMRAVYTGVAHTRDKYNSNTIDDYTQGIDYCFKRMTPSGDVEYYICGIDSLDSNLYNETVVHNLGINELKRTYVVSFDDLKVRLLDPVRIDKYTVETYEDMISLQESGAI